MKYTVAFGWPPIDNGSHNNQPIVGGSGRGDVWLEARGWESMWGDTVPSFGATVQMMKTYVYKIHRCLWMACDRQRLTQQPTKNRRPQQREVWRGDATSRRRVGNMIPLLWQKLSNKEKIQKKFTMALNGRRTINFHTTTNQK